MTFLEFLAERKLQPDADQLNLLSGLWLASRKQALAEAEAECREEVIAHAEVGSDGSAIGCRDCADAIRQLAEVEK